VNDMLGGLASKSNNAPITSPVLKSKNKD
jgi:hypothetical protein